MMKLCVPISDAFTSCETELLHWVDGVVYKEPPSGENRYAGKLALLESSLNLAACDFIDQLQCSGFASALRSGKFVTFSCDLGPVCSSYVVQLTASGFPRYMPRGGMPTDERIGEICRQNIDHMRAFYQGDIEVENLNYFATGAYERACEPEWICELVEGCGVGLALDLGHAIISAQNLDWNLHCYLDSLPLERISQIHLSRPCHVNGVLEDAHESPSECEYELVDFILARTRPNYLAVEYYKDGRQLLEVYRTLSALAKERK